MSGRYSAPAPECIRERRPPGRVVDRIVLHAMDGTLAGTEAWFKTPKRPVPTCAHYLIGRNSDVVQMCPDDKMCLHAGSPVEKGWNDRSIGIECEVRVNPWTQRRPPFVCNEWPELLLASLAKVVLAMCRKFNIPIDREHIVGHSEVPGATHTDPGVGFDWPAFMARLVPAVS